MHHAQRVRNGDTARNREDRRKYEHDPEPGRNLLRPAIKVGGRARRRRAWWADDNCVVVRVHVGNGQAAHSLDVASSVPTLARVTFPAFFIGSEIRDLVPRLFPPKPWWGGKLATFPDFFIGGEVRGFVTGDGREDRSTLLFVGCNCNA